MNQNITKAVFVVFLFWWIALGIYGFPLGTEELSQVWVASVGITLLAVLGVLLGCVGVFAYILSEKHVQRELLRGDSVRGLTCTIGELPMIAAEPTQAKTLPDFGLVPNVPPDFFASWFSRYQDSHPEHVRLMCALLKIFEHHKALPATHIQGGHGGRTLLQHSLLAAHLMDKLAASWSYSGLRDRSGSRVILKLRDPEYKFNHHEPLAALIGIAHDIGKIEAFILDEKDSSKVIGIHHEHDLTGARMIARLPEAWSIPDADRQAMFLAIAHYHHPMALPLSPDRRAIDDRTIALMELLIKADTMTSSVEAQAIGTNATSSQPEKNTLETESPRPLDQMLWESFVEIISEHGRINSPDPRFNVATLCNGKGFPKPMLLIKENSIRSAIVKRLGLEPQPLLGDGRYQLTIDLMEMLDSKEALFRTYEGLEYSAKNALWNIDFLTRPAAGAEPEKKSGWSAVIIVDPKIFPRIEQMEPYWWFAVIQRGTMGSARAITKSNQKGVLAHSSKKEPPTLNLLDAPEAEVEQAISQAQQTFGGVLRTPETSSDATSEAPSEPKTAPEAKPEATFEIKELQSASSSVKPIGKPGESQQHENNNKTKKATSEVVKSPEQKSKRQIAPIDIHRALDRALVGAKKQKIELRQVNGRYIVSSKTLKMLVPEIDWEKCRHKIENMAKSGKINAVFVAMGESDADVYALAFSASMR